MEYNSFWPIYKQLEKEFIELSFYVTIDRRQLKVYSTKIADLILRTVSEIENLAKELCKVEKIKFRDSKTKKIRDVVRFHEYIDELNKLYNLKNKTVSFDYEHSYSDTFDSKHLPFKKDKKKIKGKEKDIWSWYYAYNKIKHDRVKNFREANLGNLIESLSALFLLNLYYKNETFYNQTDSNISNIISRIELFSPLFKADYTIKVNEHDKRMERTDTFFDPVSYFKISQKFSVYLIEFNKKYKTDSDSGADFMDKMESSLLLKQEDGSFQKKYNNYELTDHFTECAIVASLNKGF